MEKDWVKVYSSPQQHIINIIKAFLESSGINFIEINKNPSSYPLVGDIELYVQKKDAFNANYIINRNEF
jgi:hypothetical protein